METSTPNTYWSPRNLDPRQTTYGYDEAGNRASITQPTGAGASLTTNYAYDRLNRLAAQTNDPVNPGHTVEFSYDGEGNQTARIDKASGAERRRVTMTYNLDGSLQRKVATTGTSHLAECHFADGAQASSGYDADGHPLVVRTLSGTTDCNGGALVSSSSFTWDDRGLMKTAAHSVAGDGGNVVTKEQSFAYDADGARTSFTHDGRTVTYGRAPAGWATSVTDWRNVASTRSYLPSGAIASETRGPDASGAHAYDADGSLTSLTWTKAGGTVVRSHTGITYDAGGMKTAEQVSTLGVDAQSPVGGQAVLAYDLAGRLTSWTSPYGDRLKTTYTLDDGGNVTRELLATSAGLARVDARFSYTNGRLALKTTDDHRPLPATVTCESFGYSELGEENQRTTTTALLNTTLTGCVGGTPITQTTTFDAAGFVDAVNPDNVDYAYDLAERVVSRKGDGQTTLYFYDPHTGRLVEEANGSGQPMVGYLLGDAGEPLAQETWRTDDPAARATAPTWVWLLADGDGNVGTHLRDNGEVLEQSTYDAYGKADEAEPSNKKPGYAGSSLGYQSDLTDPKTKKLLLGPRQYDPSTLRFTTPDTYASSQLDIALGLDELTGNRYLFAGANPSAFYEDGHGSQRKSSYTYTFDLGLAGDPRDVAAAVRTTFGDFFPFAGCGTSITVGERCDLRFGPTENPLRVVRITSSSFTFRSLKGHFEGADRLITFSFQRSKSGSVILKVHSRGPAVRWWYRVPFAKRVNRGVAHHFWERFAGSIRGGLHYRSQDGRGTAYRA